MEKQFPHFKSKVFLGTQGQLTLMSVVKTGRNSNSSKIHIMDFLVICKFKKDHINRNQEPEIQSKIKVVELSQHYS